jgi:hypothetical protein
MSRSNTPSGHPGQPPLGQGQQQWRLQPELEVPPSRGGPAQLPAAGQYAQPVQPGQLPPGYAYPPQAPSQSPAQAYGKGQPDYGYANLPASQMPGGHQFAPPPAAAYPAQDRSAQDRYAAAPQMPDLRGSQYDQWPNQPAAAAPVANPQAYDLGNYNPASPAAAYQQPAAQAYAQPGQPPQPAYASAAYGSYAPPQAEYQPQQQWSPQDAAYHGQQAHGAVNYDQQAYGQPQGGPGMAQPGYPAPGQQPQAAAGQVQAAGQYDDEDEYEEEEPRRRGRGLMVVGALIGAIGLGGGLAYGYKTFMKPPTSSNIPVARADKQPVKVKPTTPDGKQMAGSGSALQNGDEAGAPIRPVQSAAVANADAESNGSRKVQTVPVGRDGTVQSTTVPGMQMVFPSTPNQQRAMPVPNLPEAQPQQAPAQSRAAVPAPMNAPVAAPAVPAPPKKVAQAPLPKKPAVRDDLAASGGSALGASDAAPPAAAPRKTTGAGFMAVLSLQKSEIDAMRAFADLQEKTPSLQGKKPITQVIEPGGKYAGMYRLMVGPPGSAAAAKDVCAQSGIKDCYIAPY